MAASDYVPIFLQKPLASRGASTDEYTGLVRISARPSVGRYLRASGYTPYEVKKLSEYGGGRGQQRDQTAGDVVMTDDLAEIAAKWPKVTQEFQANLG